LTAERASSAIPIIPDALPTGRAILAPMRTLITRTGLVLALGAVLAIGGRGLVAQSAPSADEAGVRKALNAYFEAQATGQSEHFRRGMHADMRMSFVRDGKLVHRNLDEFVGGNSSGKPFPDEAKRKRKIVMVDITGTAAVAKIELDYPDVFFTDYMSLLNVDGEWKIVDKIFDRAPSRQAKSE
jgi:hypothetical protein